MAHTTPCQMCSEPFDWAEKRCPHCGWEKAEWIEGGRYGLQRTRA